MLEKGSKQRRKIEDAGIGWGKGRCWAVEQGWREGKMLEKGRRASRVRERKMAGAGLEEGSTAGKRGREQAD
jgi:hypothetical protein